MSILLRPYQETAIDDLRGAYGAGFRAPLLVSPTASGKTIVFSAISHSAVAKGGKVLVLAHRQELVRQTSAKLSEFNVEHGLVLPGEPKTDHPVIVASVQSVIRRLDRLPWAPSLVIVDEAHHAIPGSGHGKIIDHFPQAQARKEQAKCQSLEELKELGRARGYRGDGWALAVWKAREQRAAQWPGNRHWR